MHDKISASSISFCEKCHEPKEPHKVCYNCGIYNGEQVLDLSKKEKVPAEEKAE